MRAIGIKDFLKRKFNCYEFTGEWFDTFGEPETNFKMIVYGKPGNGKTEFCIKMAKYCSQFCRVYYNSFEQGISKSLQDALARNHMEEVDGAVIFGDKEDLESIKKRLKKKHSPRIIFLDSRDYMQLTAQQFKDLIEEFPHKSFVVICWEANGKPWGQHAKSIEYVCDIKVHVKSFVAHPRSRFGGNHPFVIWKQRAPAPEESKQGQLF
jgi:hypothetical protein